MDFNKPLRPDMECRVCHHRWRKVTANPKRCPKCGNYISKQERNLDRKICGY